MVSAEEPSRSRLDECFLTGAIKPPANARHPSSLKFMTSSRYCGTSLTCLASGPSASAALTSVDGTEEKRYERLPPLDESVAAHLCPPMAIRWKARASHPFKLCICTCWMLLLGGWTSDFGTSLYGCASGLPGQDACYAASLRDLRSATDLPLHTTKALEVGCHPPPWKCMWSLSRPITMQWTDGPWETMISSWVSWRVPGG